MTFIRCEYLTAHEALRLEHMGFCLKLIHAGIEKDLYQVFVKKG
jgi:hypothetical protein